MVTKTLIEFLKDDKNSRIKKYEFLKSLDLCYSDLFELRELFKYDEEVYPMLYSLTSYQDNKISHSVIKQETKRKNAVKQKKMKRVRRKKSYD